jgi:hypothetical protein
VGPAEPDVGPDALLALLERYGTVRHWYPVINGKPTGRGDWDDEPTGA